MSNSDKHDHDEQVECEICMKEIPQSEAEVEEASDYVAYFCGLDCYEKWKRRQEDSDK